MSASNDLDPRSIAAEVLRRVHDEQAFASAALSGELERRPQLDARDRGFVTDLVYGTLRAGRYLEGELARHAPRGLADLDSETRIALLLGAYQIAMTRVPAHAAVNDVVERVKANRGKNVAGFANAILRKFSREPRDAFPVPMEVAVTKGAPRWLLRALDRALGEGEGARFIAAGPFPPPLGLRVRKGDREAWIATLRETVPNAEAHLGVIAKRALIVQGAGDPRRLGGVASGDLVVQEEGSQRVAEALGAGPGDRVLDACAGRGNKTLLLLDAVGETGTVVACDLYESKLERLATEAAALGLPVPERFAIDWSTGRGELAEGSFDRVLVDAPCSGLGTLRRRPEILLRRTDAQLAQFANLQVSILTNAVTAVKPGGTVIYAVCSVLREELEDVIARVESVELVAIERLAPHRTGTDGYGIATLRRRLAAH